MRRCMFTNATDMEEMSIRKSLHSRTNLLKSDALNFAVFHFYLHTEGFPMPKKLIEIASEIVQTQV